MQAVRDLCAYDHYYCSLAVAHIHVCPGRTPGSAHLTQRTQPPSRSMAEPVTERISRSPKKVSVEHVEIEAELTPLPSPAHLPSAHKSSPTITPLPERRGSRITQGWTKRRIHKWRAPLLMVIFFLLGFSMSVAHCVFYPKLHGKVVGNSSRQEEKIR